MPTNIPHKTIHRKDYTPFLYEIRSVALDFDIRDGHTIVTTHASYRRLPNNSALLFLNGEDLDLLEIRLDGKILHAGTDYDLHDDGLRLRLQTPETFTLDIVTKIYPEANTRLEGLYKSGDTYCTQCEAEGFRRITYYPDRPDNMTVFTTHIEADKKDYPVLLGNGNRIEQGDLGPDRHFAIWHDPFPKPCYLFALVAGNLACVQDSFTTASGKPVDLFIYVRPGDETQCAHAMASLKKAMKWDEDTYGLEYDLDVFNIVAVSDFNMGAMENKSLNIFNTALVLAQQDTATDQDFINVESVIAHEYFHNWSGNRVTCRDWFQLSLKEGLTVFRDQEFSADLHVPTVQRIDDVTHLRRLQFPEDSGPLAHPIRPESYIEINNFYTMTVYEKGAEVIRMMRTILGPEKYRKGTDLYFSRHDGQAVTCEDFVRCLEEASGVDLSQFRLWYKQAGTPEVTFAGAYDPDEQTYTLTLSQSVPPTPGQTRKKPMHIPVTVGLVDKNGDDLVEKTLHLQTPIQSFTFPNITEPPVPSVLRNFSAPVKLKGEFPDQDLAFRMIHDRDGFNRWEAGQTLAVRVLLTLLDHEKPSPEFFMDAYGAVLDIARDQSTDRALMARALTLPDTGFIAQHQAQADPTAIHAAREKLLADLRTLYDQDLRRLYADNRDRDFSLSTTAMGRRALAHAALIMLDDAALAEEHYKQANCMTARVAALSVLAKKTEDLKERAFADFHDRFKIYPLVVDKWFSLQAAAPHRDIIHILRNLRDHPDFNIKNPNRVRSLYAAFAMNNLPGFHAVDGSGYKFLTDGILELNRINPQIAARLLGPMRGWKSYTVDRQEMMKDGLRRILETENLSPDVFEIADKSLKA